ncbi:MAG: acyl-CoA dehydrogenase family protein [Candidatus Binatia bacterium]
MLDFREEHELLRRTIRAFVEKEVWPVVDRWEEDEEVPRAVWRRLGELGILGLEYPEQYGGAGADFLSTIVLHEELARSRSAGFAVSVAAHTDMASPHLAGGGTEAQKSRFLPPLCRGELVCAIVVTEPGGGSDVAAIRTRARREGDSWVLDGTKTFITNGVNADVYFVAARTSEPSPDARHSGVTMFIVEKGTPGFSVSRKLRKMGWWASDTAELSFEDCRIPKEAVLGAVGEGFLSIMRNFQRERLVAAVGCVAASAQALDDAIAWSRDRVAFDRRLADLQAIRHSIADLATQIEAARTLTYHAAERYARGEDATLEISMAKLFATEVANRVAYGAGQIFGGYAYMREFPIERFYRDMRVWTIGAGTSEIMKEIIARRMIDD